MRVKLFAVLSAFLVVVAGCGGDDDGAELTVDEYATLLQAVEAQFGQDVPDPFGDPDSRDQYPLGGDLVVATDVYTAIDERLAGWRALTPPPELRDHHARLVEALDALQEKVGAYLMDEAFEGEDFEFESIGPLVFAEIQAASKACRELEQELQEAGASVEFHNDCQF